MAVEELYEEVLSKQPIKGKLFLDCSTVLLDVTRKVAEKILGSGAEFVAVPGQSFP